MVHKSIDSNCKTYCLNLTLDEERFPLIGVASCGKVPLVDVTSCGKKVPLVYETFCGKKFRWCVGLPAENRRAYESDLQVCINGDVAAKVNDLISQVF